MFRSVWDEGCPELPTLLPFEAPGAPPRMQRAGGNLQPSSEAEWPTSLNHMVKHGMVYGCSGSHKDPTTDLGSSSHRKRP